MSDEPKFNLFKSIASSPFGRAMLWVTGILGGLITAILVFLNIQKARGTQLDKQVVDLEKKEAAKGQEIKDAQAQADQAHTATEAARAAVDAAVAPAPDAPKALGDDELLSKLRRDPH